MRLSSIILEVGKIWNVRLIGTESKKIQKNCPIFVNRSEFTRMPRRAASVLLFDPKDALRVNFYLKIIMFGVKLLFFWSWNVSGLIWSHFQKNAKNSNFHHFFDPPWPTFAYAGVSPQAIERHGALHVPSHYHSWRGKTLGSEAYRYRIKENSKKLPHFRE